MKVKSQISMGFVLLFLASCYLPPPPLYVLTPKQQQNGFWLWGKYYQVQQNEHLTVALAYNRTFQGYYKFNVFIENRSPHPVLIDPTQFYYQTLHYQPKGAFFERRYAVDPEQAIKTLDKKQAKEAASYTADRLNRALLSFFDLVADLSPSETEKNSERNSNLDLEELKLELEHQQKEQSINHLRQLWENQALRKTTLPPQFQIQGDVFFPVNPKLSKLVIHVVVDSVDFPFHFTQSLEESD